MMLKNKRHDMAPREFHVAREARNHYEFDQDLFTLIGNVVFANFRAAREFAQKMNAKRDLVANPERAVKAGQINAMGLIDEILHLVVASYRRDVNPRVMADALQALDARIGSEAVDAALLQFAEQFPAMPIYRGEVATPDFLAGETDNVPHRELVFEEMMLLWVSNMNPAFSPFIELFDDTKLEQTTSYPEMFTSLQAYFATQPGLDVDGKKRAELGLPSGTYSLIDLLRLPATRSPDSLTGQLAFIRDHWGYLLSKEFMRVLGSLDVIAEEEKAVWVGGGGPGGPGPVEVYQFAGMEADPERF
ncbi:MAG: Alpha-amylase family protein, partial [uncultured Chloroflexia bacterium]